MVSMLYVRFFSLEDLQIYCLRHVEVIAKYFFKEFGFNILILS